MRVVILNNEREAVDYHENVRQSEDVVIPIGPSARYYGSERDWKLQPLGTLWRSGDYFSAKKASEARIQKLVEELNDYSRSVAKNFPLEIGSYFHFQLHVVIGQIHYNRFILDCIQKALNPDSWLLYRSQGDGLFMGFRPNPETILQDVFARSPYCNGMQNVTYIPHERKRTNKKLKSRIKDFIPKNAVNHILTLKRRCSTRNFRNRGKKRLLMLGAAYNWESIFSDVRFVARYQVHSNFGEAMKSSESVAASIKESLDRSIIVDGVALFDLTEQAKLIQGTLDHFDKQAASQLRKVRKYDATLVCVFTFPEQNFIGHISNALGRPVILWQHGAMNLYEDANIRPVECTYTTHYLSYAPLVNPEYESFIGSSPLEKVYTVGSPNKEVSLKESKIILYATGKWMKTATFFINAQDPDTRLYNAQEYILDYLNEIGREHKVVFKANNTPGLNEIPFRYPNVTVEYGSTFTALLEQAKLVILDTPATTCLEACSTNVPLFVLSGRTPWYERPTELLDKRAVVSDTPVQLIRDLENYLKDGIYPADMGNREFFEGYGSCADVNGTIENVLSTLQEVLESR